MTQRGRMKRNKSDKHPPKLSTKPKAGGNVSPQQQTAAGKGSCPRSPPGAAAQAPHRGATAAAAPAQNCLPSTQKPPPPPARAEAPAAPLRPGFLPFPLPPSPAPSRHSGSGFGYRTPERRRLRPEPCTLRAETKTRPGPLLLLLLPGATRLARPGTPRSPSGASSRFARSKPAGEEGGATATGLHRGPGVTLRGGEN